MPKVKASASQKNEDKQDSTEQTNKCCRQYSSDNKSAVFKVKNREITLYRGHTTLMFHERL